MKRSTAARFVIALSVLVVAWQAYTYRVRIEAWTWHIRYGTSLIIGDYIVPVRANWYVSNEGNGSYLLVRLDTDDRTPVKRIKRHAGILLLPDRPMKDEDINRLLSIEEDFVEKQAGGAALRQAFRVGDGTIYCLGGDRLGSTGIYDIEPASWRCKSTVGLDLSMGATDPDMQQVWDIVSHIRKKS